MKKICYLLSSAVVLFISACVKQTEACFTYTPAVVTKNTAVTFNAACCKDASQYIWDFGDSSNIKTTAELTVNHKYNAIGTYVVKLTAKRDKESSSGKTINETKQTIVVQ